MIPSELLWSPKVRAEVARLRAAHPGFAVESKAMEDGTVTYKLHREDPRRKGLTV